MKIFAHRRHVYDDLGTHFFMEWGDGQVREVPDEIGLVLLSVHAAKLCNVTNDPSPESHQCSKTAGYATTQLVPVETTVLIAEPPQAQGRTSRQKLDVRRQTMKRSRVARARSA